MSIAGHSERDSTPTSALLAARDINLENPSQKTISELFARLFLFAMSHYFYNSFRYIYVV